MADSLSGRRSKGALARRAALRKRALADYVPPPTVGPHGLAEDLLVMGLPAGGAGAASRLSRVVRGVDRRAIQRAVAGASERRLTEMAAPREARNFVARGGGVFTDALGTPLDPATAFEEAASATQALDEALMNQLKKGGS